MVGVMWYLDLFVWNDQRFFYYISSPHSLDHVRIRVWLALGRDPNGLYKGKSPLTSMAFKPWATAPIKVMRLLLATGADPNRRDGRGELPIVSYMAWSDLARTRLLLEAGADPNLTEENGLSVVHGIFSTLPPQHVQVYVHLFLTYGLDPCFPVATLAMGEPPGLPVPLSDHLAERGYPELGAEVAALCTAKTGGAPR